MSLINEPAEVGPVKNEITFDFTTDAYKDSSGIAAEVVLNVSDLPVADDFIIISWDGGNYQIQFTVVTAEEAAADQTGTTIPEAGSITAFVASLEVYLARNVLIDTLFTLDAVSDDLTITANNVGSKFTIQTDADEFSDWYTITTSSLGADIVLDGDFYIIAKILLMDDGVNWRELVELAHKPDSSQAVSFNFSEILKGYVDAIHLPSIGQAVEIRCTNIVKDYKVIFF